MGGEGIHTHSPDLAAVVVVGLPAVVRDRWAAGSGIPIVRIQGKIAGTMRRAAGLEVIVIVVAMVVAAAVIGSEP